MLPRCRRRGGPRLEVVGVIGRRNAIRRVELDRCVPNLAAVVKLGSCLCELDLVPCDGDDTLPGGGVARGSCGVFLDRRPPELGLVAYVGHAGPGFVRVGVAGPGRVRLVDRGAHHVVRVVPVARALGRDVFERNLVSHGAGTC